MSTESKPRATVRVRITIELESEGAWGEDCTLGQAQLQAASSVEQALRRGLIIEGTKAEGKKTKALIIGQPEFLTTIVNS